jgi:hypothetical protein
VATSSGVGGPNEGSGAWTAAAAHTASGQGRETTAVAFGPELSSTVFVRTARNGRPTPINAAKRSLGDATLAVQSGRGARRHRNRQVGPARQWFSEFQIYPNLLSHARKIDSN